MIHGDGPNPDADWTVHGRRKLLGALAAATGAGAAALATWPLAAALLAGGDGEAGPGDPADLAPFVDVAAEAEVRADFPLRATLRAAVRDGWLTTLRDLGTVFLVREAKSIVAFSGTCPHLGCAVDRAGRGFSCPCHDSRFDAQGAVLSGPAPRGLDPLPVRLEAGRVLVQALRFVPGIAARRPA